MLTSWEHSSLENTKEETSSQQPGIVLHEPLSQGNQAESKHVQGQPNSWAELLQKDVGGDLEEAVWDEEDDEGYIVLGAREAEILREAEDVCVADVDTVYVLLVVTDQGCGGSATYPSRPSCT